jgi:hypothetical protein
MVLARVKESKMYSIELDCPPGFPRPSDLLPHVISETGLVLDPEKPSSAVFGNWEWIIPEDQNTLYESVRDLIKTRITDLYNNNHIRYGSW